MGSGASKHNSAGEKLGQVQAPGTFSAGMNGTALKNPLDKHNNNSCDVIGGESGTSNSSKEGTGAAANATAAPAPEHTSGPVIGREKHPDTVSYGERDGHRNGGASAAHGSTQGMLHPTRPAEPTSTSSTGSNGSAGRKVIMARPPSSLRVANGVTTPPTVPLSAASAVPAAAPAAGEDDDDGQHLGAQLAAFNSIDDLDDCVTDDDGTDQYYGERDSLLSDITMDEYLNDMIEITRPSFCNIDDERGSSLTNSRRSGTVLGDTYVRKSGSRTSISDQRRRGHRHRRSRIASVSGDESADLSSPEESVFVYDDVVIPQVSARSKQWRVAGRKPAGTQAWPVTTGVNDESTRTIDGVTVTSMLPRRISTGGSLAPSTFMFTDFSVVVDEVDLGPATSANSTSWGIDDNALPPTGSNMAVRRSLTFPPTLSLSGTGISENATPSASLTDAVLTSPMLAQGSAFDGKGGASTDLSHSSSKGPASSSEAPLASDHALRDSANHVPGTPLKNSFTVTNLVPAPATEAAAAAAKEMSPVSRREVHRVDVTNLMGHVSRVKCIAMGPDEKEYASCSHEDASISIRTLDTNNEIGLLTGHSDTIISAAFSPDGKMLATTSRDKTMVIWDVVTTKMVLAFGHARVVICCAFSPDSKYVVSGCQDKVCRVWDVQKGRSQVTFTKHESIIIAAVFSPDGATVCSASADKTVRLWSATTGAQKTVLLGHAGIVLSCSFTSDGNYVVSNDEKALRVWHAASGKCVLNMNVDDHANWLQRGLGPAASAKKMCWTLSCAAPGPFAGYMLAACNNRFLYVLDLFTGEEVTSFYCRAPIYSIGVGTSSRIGCGDSYGNIYMLTFS